MSGGSQEVEPIFESVRYSTWHDRVAGELDGADPADVLSTRLVGGLSVRPLYTRETASLLGGPEPPDRRDPGWLVGQSYRTRDREALAGAIAEDLAGGVQGFTLRLDPELIGGEGSGRDAFDPERIEALMAQLFDGERGRPDYVILLSDAPPVQIAQGVIRWWEHLGSDDRPRIALGIDPLASAANQGRFPAGRGEIAAQVCQAIEMARIFEGRLHALTVSSHLYVQAGADAGLEVATALSTALDYLRLLEEAGVAPSETAAQLVFRFALGKDMFCDIAKLRAFRTLWRQVARTAGFDSLTSQWIDAETSPSILSRVDVETNLLRTCNGAVAAVIGGADTVSCAPYDLLRREPGGRGRRLARNIQHILGQESHLGRVVDPTAGSYYVETLGHDLAQEAWSHVRHLESRGGIWAVLTTGELQQELADLWQERRSRFAHREDPITGVSVYVKSAAGETSRPEPMPSDRPLLRPIRWPGLEPGPEIAPIERHRDSEEYEQLRAQSDRLGAETGARPTVLLAPRPDGLVAREAVSFARNLFAAGGFAVVVESDPSPISGGEPGSTEPGEPDQPIVCLCLGDDITEMPRVSNEEVASSSSGTMLVAAHVGPPSDDLEIPESIEILIRPGIDAVAVLRRALDHAAGRTRTAGTS